MKVGLSEIQETKFGEVSIYEDGTTLSEYTFLSSVIETRGIGKGFLRKLNRWIKKQKAFNVKQIAVFDNLGRENKAGETIDVHFYKSVKPSSILAQVKKYKEPMLRVKMADREYSYNPNADVYYKPEKDDADTAQANDQDNYYIHVDFNARRMYASTYMKEKFPEELKHLHLTFAKHFNQHSRQGVRLSITVPADGKVMALVKQQVYPRQALGFALEKVVEQWGEEKRPWPAFSGVVGNIEATIRGNGKITVPELAVNVGATKKTVYRWLPYIKHQVGRTHRFISGAGKMPGYFEKITTKRGNPL